MVRLSSSAPAASKSILCVAHAPEGAGTRTPRPITAVRGWSERASEAPSGGDLQGNPRMTYTSYITTNDITINHKKYPALSVETRKAISHKKEVFRRRKLVAVNTWRPETKLQTSCMCIILGERSAVQCGTERKNRKNPNFYSTPLLPQVGPPTVEAVTLASLHRLGRRTLCTQQTGQAIPKNDEEKRQLQRG